MAKHSKAKDPDNVFDQFHNYKVCDIPATHPKRVDTMKEYRPKPDPHSKIKDYNLTQAYTIMDRDPVKVHFTDTSCEYTFHPAGFNPSLVLRGEHGRGPLEKELMEEFAQVVDYYQYLGYVNLRRLKRIKARKERLELKRINERFERTIGPDWFQELSKLQAEAVDDLAKAIVKDLRLNTIEHTQCVIGRLGIVLRPSHCTVRKALKLCSSCPVEFLLVLYQLMNPDRSSYSVSDRLLLSAVMHLTIRSTLRELHIRIPSPPRDPVPKKKPRVSVPKPKPSSPYLEDITPKNLTPQQNFHYPNRYYTNHDYFDYIEQLKLERTFLRASPEGDTKRDFQFNKIFAPGVCTCKNCASPNCSALKDLDVFTCIELDLLTEWTRAQKYYTSISKGDCVPALGKASVYICPLGKFLPRARSESLSHSRTLSLSHHSHLRPALSQSHTRSLSHSHTNSQPKQTSIAPDAITPAIKTKTGSSSKGFAKDFTVMAATDEPEAPKALITPYTSPVPCACNEVVSKSTIAMLIAQLEAEFNCICSIGEDVEEEEAVIPPPCTVRDYSVGRTLTVKAVESQTCACKEAILKRIEESLCPCERCVEDRRKANSFVTHVIADTKEVDDKPLPIIMDCKTKAICTCMEKYKKRWERFEQQRGIRKVQEAIKSLDERFIINGTAIGPDGKIVYIISSVQPTHCCQCAKIKDFEEEAKETLKKMPMLPGGCIKYHISGVQERPDGNVYIVAGTTENTECDCMQLYERFTREHQICLKLYNEYLKKIAYDVEEYMKDLDPGYGEFEAAATWTGSEVQVVKKACKCHADRSTQMSGKYCRCVCEDTSETEYGDSGECLCSVESCPCADNCECVTEEGGGCADNSLFGLGECSCSLTDLSIQQGNETTDNCSCSKFEASILEKSPKGGNNNPLAQSAIVANVNDNVKPDNRKLDGNKIPEKRKSAGGRKSNVSIKSDIPKRSSKADEPAATESEDSLMKKIRESYKTHPLYQFEDPPVLDRYIIVKALPRTEQEQDVVLKKALQKLAEDGFPLARLPEVHRLPIFRAWWRYRLGFFRTEHYRNQLLNVTDRHLLVRMETQRARPEELRNVFLHDRPNLQNWDHHDMIKKHNMALRAKYYRETKANTINCTRKLYTLMGSYEFPNKTFRDVFFAYMPSKDEDIMLDQIWKSSEYSDHSYAKPCL